MRSPLRLAALGGLTALLALAGCGGGGGGTKLSRSGLDRKAGPICRKASTEIAAVKPPADFLQNPKAAAVYLDKVVAIADAAMTKLDALKPVSDEKVSWNTFVAKQQQQTDLFRKVLSKAQAQDRSGITDLQSAVNLTASVDAAARAAGVPGCATGG
jgi:hypothetical protein